MATTYFPVREDNLRVAINVPNPGYGYALLDLWRDGAYVREDWLLTPPMLGRLLDELLAWVAHPATAPWPEALGEHFRLNLAQTHAVLRAVAHAAVEVAAAADRDERMFPSPQDPPFRPLCAYCNEGTTSSTNTGEVTVSERCANGQHYPWGEDVELKDQYGAWRRAQERHALDLIAWERRDLAGQR